MGRLEFYRRFQNAVENFSSRRFHDELAAAAAVTVCGLSGEMRLARVGQIIAASSEPHNMAVLAETAYLETLPRWRRYLAARF